MATGLDEQRPRGQGLGRDNHVALESILAFDSRIRCVVEVGLDGKQIACVCREGLESLEPEGESARVLNRIAIFAGAGASMNGYHGRVRAAIVVKEKLSLVVFPLFDSLILVSADPEFPLQKTRLMARLLDKSSSPGPESKETMEARSGIPTFRELKVDVL